MRSEQLEGFKAPADRHLAAARERNQPLRRLSSNTANGAAGTPHFTGSAGTRTQLASLA